MDWDFYFYVGNTILGWDMETFWNVTPNHLLKQYIMHVRYTNPEALNEETQKEVYYINETPFGR